MPFDIYQVATTLCKPLMLYHLNKRKEKGKEDRERFGERLGIPSVPRPEGKLIWLHGASVGETVSMLPLIDKILAGNPNAHILVTSGTVTSAEIMAKRLPKRAFHQYVPVDIKGYTDRFVRYWKPDVALWFESDFWPNLLHSAHNAGVPLILINGRISDKSFKMWRYAEKYMAELQGMFALSLGQTELDTQRLDKLGAKNTASLGNIKYAAPTLPCNEVELANLRQTIGTRKVFVAASTHDDEEKKIAIVHQRLKALFPDLLTVIAPRHPTRGTEIADFITKMGLGVALRSKKEPITPKVDVYIADTIGEMGLVYRLADIVFVGGSLIPHGGQNFLEPARLASAVVVGPHMENFKEMTAKALSAEAILQVNDTDELVAVLTNLFNDKTLRCGKIQKAEDFATKEGAVLQRVYEKVMPWIL